MNDAKPCDNHMSFDTLKKVLEFMTYCDPHQIIITGGEPTEHPQFMDMVIAIQDYISQSYGMMCFLIIASNGYWCLEHPIEARFLVQRSEIPTVWQISTDDRYYPKPTLPTHKRLWKEEGFELCTDCVQMITPMGRAADLQTTRTAPSCFNIRSVINSTSIPTLAYAVAFMEQQCMKYCTPAVKYDGSVILGESDLCPGIGDVFMSPEELMQNAKSFACQGCKRWWKLTDEQLMAINVD